MMCRYHLFIALLVVVLAAGVPAYAQLSVHATGGFAGNVNKEAIGGFSETKFGPTSAYGAGVNYRFKNGVSLGVNAEQLRMNLKEDKDTLGRLQLKPVLLTLGYQGKPKTKNGRGVTGHAEFGGGRASPRFEKGSAITGLESQYRAQVRVRTTNTPVFSLSAGVDYFVSRHVSFTTDMRFLIANVGTSWAAVGYRTVPIPNINKFGASTGQVLGGLKLWLW